MLLSVISYGAENIGILVSIGDIAIPESAADIKGALKAVLTAFEEFHERYRGIHEELEGLQHTDEDVRKLYSKITEEKMSNVTAMLAEFLQDDTNIREKAYAAIGIMEQHCHMMMNNELWRLNAYVMRDLTIDAVLSVITGLNGA